MQFIKNINFIQIKSKFFNLKKNCLIILFLLEFFIVKGQYHTEIEYLKFEGYERSFRIFVPESYSLKKNYPLVFVLHGGGGQAKGLVKTTRARFNNLANRDGFIVVYPNGIEKSWNDGARDTIGFARKQNINDVGFFEKLIKNLQLKFAVDSSQIFACGISNGGFMVQRLAYELPDKIKGIGVVAANLSLDQSEKKTPDKPVPIIFINGTEDPLVPYNGGQVAVFKSNRGAVLSVPESIEIWKEINACSVKVETYSFPDVNKKDECVAIKTIWQNSENPKIKVVAVKVKNGGHTWPGTNQYLPRRLVGNTNNDFNGCDEIWNFFKSIIE